MTIMQYFPYVMGGTALMLTFMFASLFFQRYIRYQDTVRQREENAQIRQEAAQEKQADLAARRQEEAAHLSRRQSEDLRTMLEKMIDRRTATNEAKDRQNSLNNEAGLNSGGYIIFDMPESAKSMFHDLLKGFEDYAKLRGYVIAFSIDNSFPNKVAFKFTLDSHGVTVSTNQVRADLKEYIERVQRGDSLEDLPVIISQEEHDLVVTHLKNRISFLQHNYTLEKNAKEFYIGLMKQIPQLGAAIAPPQNFYIGDGQKNQHLLAMNSPQAALGEGNRVIENQLDQSIHIADSFNERKEQVEALSSMWVALFSHQQKSEKEEEKKAFSKAETLVRKAQTEMEEEEPPDPTRLKRWLTTAKHTLGTLALTGEVGEACKKVWELFGLS